MVNLNEQPSRSTLPWSKNCNKKATPEKAVGKDILVNTIMKEYSRGRHLSMKHPKWFG